MTQGITPYAGHTNPTYSRNNSGHTHPNKNPPRKADDHTPLEKEIWFELVEMN